MTCSYCGARNSDGEHRCQRCGRKPSDTLNSGYRTDGALATKLRPVDLPDGAEQVRIAPPPDFSAARQRTLFQERPESNVIPFDSFAPPAPPKLRPRTNTARQGKPVQRRSKIVEGQGSLDFLPPAPAKPRTLSTTVDSVIYCDAPVATALHRAIAAGLDWFIVTMAYVCFLGTYYLIGGRFAFDRLNLIIFGSAFVLIALTYGLAWTIANRETAGMRCLHLRLTTFDGFRPELGQRVARFFGSCLSLCTVVGLLWSLADEEALAWQDHISGTFPTPRVHDSQVLVRR